MTDTKHDNLEYPADWRMSIKTHFSIFQSVFIVLHPFSRNASRTNTATADERWVAGVTWEQVQVAIDVRTRHELNLMLHHWLVAGGNVPIDPSELIAYCSLEGLNPPESDCLPHDMAIELLPYCGNSALLSHPRKRVYSVPDVMIVTPVEQFYSCILGTDDACRTFAENIHWDIIPVSTKCTFQL